MPRLWRRLVAMAVTALCLLPALGVATAVGGSQHALRAQSLPRPPTLRLAMPDVSPTADPALVADEDNVELASLLYSGLVRLDASYHVIPDAAQSISLSSDHLTYTFHLRKGMHFSNGDPLTAADFEFAMNRSLSPAIKSPSATTYLLDIKGATAVATSKAKSVSGIRVVNALTLEVRLRYPVPYFLMELTYPTSYALDKKRLGTSDNTSWYTDPVGSGPYKVKSWNPDSKIVLTPNTRYYGPRLATGQVAIFLNALPGSSQSLYQYVSHSLDIAPLPSYDSKLARLPGIHDTPLLAIAGIYMNFSTKPMSNGHVRQALMLALKRQALVSSSMGSMVSPFTGFVPPGQLGFDGRLRVPSPNLETARKELALAGYPAGKGFPVTTLYYSVDPNDTDMARAIRDLVHSIVKRWHTALRLPIDSQELTLNTLFSKAQSGSLPLYVSGWSANYPDPHDWLSSQWKSDALNNNVHFNNKRFDTVVSAADATWSYQRRLGLYDEAQQILVNNAAWIPLYIPHRLVYVRPTVKNLVVTGYGIIPRSGRWADVDVTALPAKGRVL